MDGEATMTDGRPTCCSALAGIAAVLTLGGVVYVALLVIVALR